MCARFDPIRELREVSIVELVVRGDQVTAQPLEARVLRVQYTKLRADLAVGDGDERRSEREGNVDRIIRLPVVRRRDEAVRSLAGPSDQLPCLLRRVDVRPR